MKVSIANSILKDMYPYFLIIVDQLQVLCVISLFGVIYPEKMMMFFRLIRHSLLNFEVISIGSDINHNRSHIEYNLQMRNLGFHDASVINNLLNWTLIIPSLIVIHLTLYFLFESLVFHKKKGFLLQPLGKFVQWMLPGAYIKLANLSLVLILLSSLHEIQEHYDEISWTWSWSTAVGITSLCILYIMT